MCARETHYSLGYSPILRLYSCFQRVQDTMGWVFGAHWPLYVAETAAGCSQPPSLPHCCFRPFIKSVLNANRETSRPGLSRFYVREDCSNSPGASTMGRGTRAGRPASLQYRNEAVKEEEPKDGNRCSLERGVAIRLSPESAVFITPSQEVS